MKARLITIVSLVLALALLAGIPAFAGNMTAAELNVSEIDAGRQIDLDKAHVLVLNLQANPSTGYGWYVDSVDGKVLRQVGEAEFAATKLLGAPTTQIVRFQAVAAGQTMLNLSYRRPWENVKPEKTFSINVRAKGALALPYKSAPVDTAPVSTEGSSVSVLPTVYNWCDLGYCTPIRNQGSCGSCWAFSTVGSFEQSILIKDGLSKDLSEQYLVSCNSDGWSCSGGWYAHDYHQWKYITGETGPGAVYEADFPYTATNATCVSPYPHHELISSWANIGGTTSVAPTADIKNAIYTYGPVSVAVYVGTAFQSYTTGIFNPTIRGSKSVNHAVVLTGWNDTYSYWNMRNSWGTSWGEAGYMRIAYGNSQIGYNTTYVVYP